MNQIIEHRKLNKKEKMILTNHLIKVLNCKMKLELRNWDKGACPFIPIRAAASPYSQFFV